MFRPHGAKDDYRRARVVEELTHRGGSDGALVALTVEVWAIKESLQFI
jgi:hypothetical protein